MRILHFDAGREMRGGQWQALRLIEGLAAAGVESTLLAREGGPLYDAARKRGWRVEPLGLLRAVKHARRHDLMHAHDARTHTMGALVRGAPLVVARRVAFPIGTHGRAGRQIGSKWKYRRARHYLAVSEFVKSVLIEGGVAAEKISVVYDGVPVLPGARSGNPPRVIAVQKGATLVGEASGLAGVPITLVTDLERDLRDASMMVYITHAEGLGSAALLAMSAGVPVIASKMGGLPEIIRDGETGLLVKNHAAADRRARFAGCWTNPSSLADSERGPPRRSSNDSRWNTWSAVRWKSTGRCSLDRSHFALLFGLLIGSFLNVCIHRWPRGRSVVRPRSHCVRCRKIIAWYDNVPVVSYLMLRGRCRHCGRHISARYPAVELLTGVVFFYFFWRLGPGLPAVKDCIFAAILIALVFSDLEKRLLPDELTLGGALIGLALAPFAPVNDELSRRSWLLRLDLSGPILSLCEAAVGGMVPALFLWGGGWLYLKMRHREGLGFGDVKLMVMIGVFLGLQRTLTTLLAGSIAGSVISILYIWLAKKDASTYELPFGTFLGAAALAVAMAQ